VQLDAAIKTLNGLWTDTITGLTTQLGYPFISEMLTGQVLVPCRLRVQLTR
jgi:hypothetical protein